jgi:hypothetical protein
MISLVDLVGDPHVFEREHWGRRPLLRRSQLDFRDLLDLEAAERLLLTSARRPTFRLVQEGRTLPPDRSTSPVPMGGTSLDDVADVAKVADAIGAGATLVLQALQRTWPPLIELCRRLERELSHPVQANAYLTPAGASGLARHADDHDVLVLQVSGRKAWDVEVLGEVTLTTGDVLYLPAGTEHAATAQDQVSLHLTLGIHRVTYAQVVHRALRQVEGVDLAAPLPIGFAAPDTDGDLAALVADRLDIAASALRSLDALDVARREQQRARTRRAPLGTGRLASTLAVDDIDLSTAVVAPEDTPAEVGAPAADGRIVLRLRDREVHLPPATGPALDCLLAGDPVKVGELPGLSDASRVVVARRLVREGWLLVAG